jgi:hypothetical protein
VLESTRGKNILDLVLSSDISMVANLTVGEPLENSDYCSQKWNLVVRTLKAKEINQMFYNYYKADYDLAKNIANQVNWEEMMESEDVLIIR